MKRPLKGISLSNVASDMKHIGGIFTDELVTVRCPTMKAAREAVIVFLSHDCTSVNVEDRGTTTLEPNERFVVRAERSAKLEIPNKA